MVKQISVSSSVDNNGSTINVYKANKGEGLPKHNHNYSHITMCREGSCIVRREGEADVILTKQNRQINLVAHNWHEIEALEDGTVFVNMFFSQQQNNS